jgi:CHAD domain-containing protein
VHGGLERELKFELPEPVDVERLGGRPLDSRLFTSVYYDTGDLRLMRHGQTLRRRLENGMNLWQLKLSCGDVRLELQEPGGPGDPPQRLAALLSGVLRGREVEPVATLATRRSGRRVDGVDVTLDEVEVLDGHAVVKRFTEIEAELVDGSMRALEAVARRLRDLGARRGNGTPKVLRAIEIPGPPETSHADAPLGPLRAYLSAQCDELLRFDPVVRAHDDADAVHDMRVAIRRLRSVLRTAKPMLAEQWVDSLRHELDWLAGLLGAVRDLDVLREDLGREAREIEPGRAARAEALLRHLVDEHRHARDALLEGMREQRYHELLDAVEAAAEAPQTRRSDLTLEALAAKEFRKLRKRGRGLAAMEDRRLHKTRIRVKRARYATELVERSLGKDAKRLISAAKKLQDVLGEYQDAVVARPRLVELARLAPDADCAVLAGRLIEVKEQRKRRARRELPKAWRRVKRHGRHAYRGA